MKIHIHVYTCRGVILQAFLGKQINIKRDNVGAAKFLNSFWVPFILCQEELSLDRKGYSEHFCCMDKFMMDKTIVRVHMLALHEFIPLTCLNYTPESQETL